MSATRKTKAELVAEVGALQDRVDALADDAPGNRRSKVLLRAFIDSLSNCSLMVNTEGRLLQLLASASTGSAASAPDLEGRLLNEILPGEDADALVNAVLRSGETGQETSFDFVLSNFQGRFRYEAMVSPQQREPGNGHVALCAFTDVSEKNADKNDLHSAGSKESEERYWALMEQATVGIFVADTMGNYVDVNPQGCEMLGYTRREFLGLNIQDLMAAEEYEKHRELLAAVKAGKVVAAERTLLHKDGSQVPVEISAKMLSDGRLLGVVRDRTRQIEAEAAIRESEERLRLFMDAASDGFSLFDSELRFVEANNKVLERIGKTREEVIGKKLLQVFSQATQLGRFDKYQEVLKTGVAVEVEGWVDYPAAGPCYIVFRAFPVGSGLGVISTDLTERKRAEGEILASQRLLQTVFDSIPVAVHLKGLDGTYLMANKALSKTHHMELDSIEGRNAATLTGGLPNEIETILKADREVVETGATVEIPESTWTFPDGRVQWRRSLKAPLLDGDGNVTGIVTAREDITDRKKAEEALRESEKRFRDFAEISSDWFWEMGPDLRFTWFSGRMEQVAGVPAAFHIGKTRKEVAAADEDEDAEKWAHHLDDLENRRPFRDFRYWRQAPDGKLQYLTSSGTPTFDPEGNFLGYRGTGADITEHQQAEEELRRSQALLQTVFEALPHAVFVKDTESRFVMANHVMAASLGLSVDELINMPTADLPLDSHQTAQLLREDRQVLQTGQRLETKERPMQPANRAQTHWDVAKVPFRNDAGKLLGIVGVLVDVTERRKLEEQLRQSQKLEALGTLAGGIAHDFNNILAPILGYSELLLEEANPGSEDHSYLSSIASSAHRAKDLVSQILLFSRRGRTARRICDLGPVVREVIRLARSTLPKTITIREQISDSAPEAFCDPSQIHQILLNLCVNAGQAIGDLGELEISLKPAELHGLECYAGTVLRGKFAQLTVTDDGTGMDKETLKQIFDPFFTTKGIGEGTGLGLSTVFGIVQEHDGGITVSSALGVGTTFQIFLPAVEAKTGTSQTTPEPAPKGSESILFIDDEEAIASWAKIILERSGYRVTSLSDSRQALETFRADPGGFDLVITDQSMPNMKGEWLVKELRALNPKIPIILCTGHSESMTPEKSKQAGINAFLYKPTDPQKLGVVIREVLDGKK